MSDVSESKFRIFREDNLDKFYTKEYISDILVGLFKGKSYKNIVDLGCGDGSLSISASYLWPEAKFFTVDIDRNCMPQLYKIITPSHKINHIHVVHDVFDFELPNKIGKNNYFDLAICNPPFSRLVWNDNFSKILQKSGFSEAICENVNISSDTIFLAQNLILVKDGGAIAIIVPDGFVTGQNFKSIRREIMKKNSIDNVIQLPEKSFHHTDARCFIIKITKSKKQLSKIKLSKYDFGDELLKELFINFNDAEDRMDYDYYVNYKKKPNSITIENLGADIRRGSIGKIQTLDKKFPTFHTTNFSQSIDGKLSFTEEIVNDFPEKCLIAEPGDILIARVDRKLYEKVCIIEKGCAAITDCVYRVRLPKFYQNKVFQYLRSEKGSIGLKSVSKGVSARLLGKKDLLSLSIEIE